MSAAPKEPHYTKIPEWVSECGANGMESALYQHLAKRLNHTSKSRVVDPSRARLAADLGLKKPDDVDPYIRGLQALGVIAVRSEKGKRTSYELPLWPPEGWAGPPNTVVADRWQKDDPKGYAAWRAGQRAKVDAAEAPYAAKRRARVSKSVARKRTPADVPVATGTSEEGDVPVATGRRRPGATGTYQPVATGTNQDEPNDQTNRGDGRRPTTGSRGLGVSGSAASSKTDLVGEKAKPGDLRAVIEAIPEPLAQLLARDWPRGLPVAVNQLIEQALISEQRTVEELVERIGRRWVAFGYENDLMDSLGKGIRTSLGVLEELVSASKCWGNNLDCEDGIDRRTGDDCPRCVEQRAERRADREPLPPEGPTTAVEKPTPTPAPYVPEQRDDAVGINEEQRALAREVLRGRTRLPR
jgi:hypothetical protein